MAYKMNIDLFFSKWIEALEEGWTLEQMAENVQSAINADDEYIKQLKETGVGYEATAAKLKSKMLYYRKSDKFNLGKKAKIPTSAKKNTRRSLDDLKDKYAEKIVAASKTYDG